AIAMTLNAWRIANGFRASTRSVGSASDGVRFLEKALRTPRTARRWFRIEDIEPDADACSNLIAQWRASIWHRDLCLGGKSQVLCLSVSPLAGNRFDPDMARGEQFNAVVGDLWVAARGWLVGFRKEGPTRNAPAWLEAIMQLEEKQASHGRPPDYDHDDAEQFVFKLLNERGDFTEFGQVDDWNRQRHVEDALRDYLSNRCGKEPSASTVRRMVTKQSSVGGRAGRERMKEWLASPRATPAADRERQPTDDDQQRLCESGSVDGRCFTCRYGYVFPQPARSTGPTGCTPCNSFNVFPARVCLGWRPHELCSHPS